MITAKRIDEYLRDLAGRADDLIARRGIHDETPEELGVRIQTVRGIAEWFFDGSRREDLDRLRTGIRLADEARDRLLARRKK